MRQETTMAWFAAGEDYRVNKFDSITFFDTVIIFWDFSGNHIQHINFHKQNPGTL